MAVVIATRVPTERVLPLYASKGGGVSLRALGCVRADNLSVRKARVLLMLALAQSSGRIDPVWPRLRIYFAHT